jgi:hypothetical protein
MGGPGGSTPAKQVPAAAGKSAQSMTAQEAFDVLMYLVDTGEITLEEPVKTNAKGAIVSPAVNDQIRVRTSMAGIDFYQASGDNGGVNGSKGAHKVAFFMPTAAFAIVLYRLAVRMRDSWKTTRIVWGGIGHGSGLHKSDCHMTGNCVDFYGATTGSGTFDVRKDWFLRRVTQKNGKLHPLAPDDNDRWGNATETFYRFATATDDEDKEPGEFFLDVYTFVSEQCMFGPFDIPPSSMTTGSPLKAGYTLHPDYPIRDQRRHHNDHIHFQLGQAILKP